MKIDKKHLLNYSILIPYLILSVLGLIVVYSTTSPTSIQAGGNGFGMVMNQGIFWIISLFIIALLYRIRLGFLKKGSILTIVIFAEIILLLLSRFITGTINGAHGWLKLGAFSIQPAEYLKIILVWYLAFRFTKRQEEIKVYDYQALTHNHWFPKAFNDWRTMVAILIGIVAIMIVLIGFFQFSAMHLQGEIDRAEQTLKSPEMAQELKAVSETEDKIVTVKNDELLFTSLEGDFRRLHRVNKAFMDFLNKNVTRNLVFDDIKINNDNVEINGSSQEHLSIAKFEEELRKSEKFNHIFVDNITREEKDNNTVYKFNIKILTKDVDFNEEQK